MLAGEQAQPEMAFIDVLLGHAAAPLAWQRERAHELRQRRLEGQQAGTDLQ